MRGGQGGGGGVGGGQRTEMRRGAAQEADSIEVHVQRGRDALGLYQNITVEIFYLAVDGGFTAVEVYKPRLYHDKLMTFFLVVDTIERPMQ